jgi:hypothetical protein
MRNIEQHSAAPSCKLNLHRNSRFGQKESRCGTLNHVGVVSYNGHIEINSSLLDAVLRDKPELKNND